MRKSLKKKIGLATLLGLNLFGIGQMSTSNYQKKVNQLIDS